VSDNSVCNDPQVQRMRWVVYLSVAVIAVAMFLLVTNERASAQNADNAGDLPLVGGGDGVGGIEHYVLGLPSGVQIDMFGAGGALWAHVGQVWIDVSSRPVPLDATVTAGTTCWLNLVTGATGATAGEGCGQTLGLAAAAAHADAQMKAGLMAALGFTQIPCGS
jgi:hypothetical protein